MSNSLQNLIAAKVTEAPSFSLERDSLGAGGTIVAVHGELDMLTVPVLRAALTEELEAGVSRLVLDLSDVSFIDSVSLAAIVNTRRRMGAGGRLAVVIEEGSYAMLIFEIGGLDSVVELFHTRSSAVAQLSV